MTAKTGQPVSSVPVRGAPLRALVLPPDPASADGPGGFSAEPPSASSRIPSTLPFFSWHVGLAVPPVNHGWHGGWADSRGRYWWIHYGMPPRKTKNEPVELPRRGCIRVFAPSRPSLASVPAPPCFPWWKILAAGQVPRIGMECFLRPPEPCLFPGGGAANPGRATQAP